MKIINNVLYADDGTYLKRLECPHSFEEANISGELKQSPLCNTCDKSLINCDYYDAETLKTMLLNDPETCLFINPCNPMFKRCNK